MKEIEVFTDGACRGNPGLGGWGVLIEYENITKEYFGGEKNTTNNKMELKAAIEGLKILKEACEVNITTDSKYVMDGITSWINNWKKNNWKNASKKDVKNKDLWIELYKLNQSLNVKWNWVKAHAGDTLNEEADMLAKKAANSD